MFRILVVMVVANTGPFFGNGQEEPHRFNKGINFPMRIALPRLGIWACLEVGLVVYASQKHLVVASGCVGCGCVFVFAPEDIPVILKVLRHARLRLFAKKFVCWQFDQQLSFC